ncbi:MAG: prepilin-type N-terminal cleavage/methylation domain-containing protein, partial [Leptospiraceae bacterium]|nr:prepilin-type N-terminal cleavage/methylation domain-containing protein [Leptospiraceae bacterium]
MKPKHRRGLTLVEIIVVVSILGLLISMTVSSLMNLIIPSVSNTSEKLKAALFFCYQTAILSNQTVVLTIDFENNKYKAIRIQRTEKGLEKKVILESGMPINTKFMSITDIRGIKHETGFFSIPFTHTGIAEDYNIHLGNGSNVSKTVQLFRYNGRIEIKNGEEDRTSG